MAPITLIYGPNSSGKSSIIQSLLMMSQTLNGRLPDDRTELITRGRNIDLGNFASVIHKHNQANTLEFEYELFEDQFFRNPFGKGAWHKSMHGLPLKKIALRFNAGVYTSKHKSPILSSFGFQFYGEHFGDEEFDFDRIKNESIKNNIKITADRYSKIGVFGANPSDEQDDSNWSDEILFNIRNKKTTPELLKILEKFYEFEPAAAKWKPFAKAKSEIEKKEQWFRRDTEIKNAISNIVLRRDRQDSRANRYLPSGMYGHEGNAGALSKSPLELLPRMLRAIDRELQEIIGGLTYLGPLRSHPARYYSVEGVPGNSVGSQGEQIVQILFNDMSRRDRPSILSRLNLYLDQFEIPYILDIKNIGDEITGDILVLSLIDKRTMVRVGPSDVGFGIGQLLPILIEGLLIKERVSDRILCVEQPEIHLHPRLQAALADFFIDTGPLSHESKSGKRIFGSGAQWILETHSEALMLRLQRRIREKKISNQDVSVLYVDPRGDKGSTILELRLDEDGEFIDLWPDGFFVESLAEIMGGR